MEEWGKVEEGILEGGLRGRMGGVVVFEDVVRGVGRVLGGIGREGG